MSPFQRNSFPLLKIILRILLFYCDTKRRYLNVMKVKWMLKQRCVLCENIDFMSFERYESQMNIETTLCAFCENIDSMLFERYERQMNIETTLCAL